MYIYYFNKYKKNFKPCFIRMFPYLYPYKAPEQVQSMYPSSRLAHSHLQSRNDPASATYFCHKKSVKLGDSKQPQCIISHNSVG